MDIFTSHTTLHIEDIISHDHWKENYMKLHEKLVELRKAKGNTQKELAEFCGVGQANVSTWETGKRKPEKNNILKIAEFYGVSPAELRDMEDAVLYTEQEKMFLDLIEKNASIEMTDAELMNLFNFSVDGHVATPDEIRGAIAYIRALRSTLL